MKKSVRLVVYNKYKGHCAYCGKKLEYKDFQVDHIIPKRRARWQKEGIEGFENYNPACRRCNHYKRAHSLERFRELLITLPDRIKNQYIGKVAMDYGIIKVEPFNGKFYFETLSKREEA